MAKPRNQVIAGKYQDACIAASRIGLRLSHPEILISKSSVESYKLLTAESILSWPSSAIQDMFGRQEPNMLKLLSVITPSSKEAIIVAIKWRRGDKSILEIDNKLYKTLVRVIR